MQSGNPARACGIVYLGSDINTRLMTWQRAKHEIFARPHGELNCMADLLGCEGVLSWLSLLDSM